MKLYEKLIQLGNQVGKEIEGNPCGQKLIQHFVNSLELSDKSKFKVKTNKGKDVFLSPKRIRSILIAGDKWNNPTKGKIGRREAAIALLRWEIKKSQ